MDHGAHSKRLTRACPPIDPSNWTIGPNHGPAQLTGNRVDHNTIVRNDTPPDTMCAGGLYCDAAGTAANNLIANNFTGNEQFPNAQVAGNCVTTGSLISESDLAFHLVRSTAQPIDYRIADEQSIAVDAGSILAMPLGDDFDGQSRSDGKPDVGADELVP